MGLMEERLAWYRRSLAQWNADSTSAAATVVVTSGRTAVGGPCGPALGELTHLEVIAFEHSLQLERRFCGLNGTSRMGEHELVSIGVAMRHSRRINSRRATHVLKLTGRYYVPGLATHLRGLRSGTALIRQGGRLGQCMTFGCKRGEVCRFLFGCPYEYYGHCEATQKRRMNTSMLRRSTLQLPWLPVQFTVTGSGKQPVAELEGLGASGTQIAREVLSRATSASADLAYDLRVIRQRRASRGRRSPEERRSQHSGRGEMYSLMN